MATIAERVAAGAVWLDEQRPGWEREIDLERLALKDCDHCVLGQIYGGFAAGLDVLYQDEDKSSKARGFAGPWSEYPALTAAWKALIIERRAREGGPR